ncbi:glycosyltransferase [Morganella morganii]|uniref:Glycosyltransferase n=1 Tax=Morganella morganii TaxID=582 RepID=A0A9Q4CQN1_MORMO|nr:glycosyltransferase [Morganella morganii]MCY0791185.1 glycosyltransferase [Morganella morganii]
MIPKKIHYCWFGKKEKPALVKKCLENWTHYFPGWEIIEWNEDNSPLHIPYVKNALNKKRYAFAADYVRFYALYTHGGIYLDTDMEIIKDLTPLLENDFFIGKESNEFINAAVVASKKNGRIANVILDALNREDAIIFQSIPKIITTVINNEIGIENLLSSEKIYDFTYFYPYNPYDKDRNDVDILFYSDIKPETYAIHHWQKSWKFSFYERVIHKIRSIKNKNT